MTRLVKRYGGERLYDTVALGYTTVAVLRALQAGGEAVMVRDAVTGLDITAALLG